MIVVAQYLKRSTIILLISLGVVIVVAVWCQQYLAVRNAIVFQQTSVDSIGTDTTIVKDLPIQGLRNEQVLTLRFSPTSAYAQQVVGQNKDIATPDVPTVTVTNTQLGNSVAISWYNQPDKATPDNTTLYDGIMIYRSSEATIPGELLTTLAVTQDGSYYDTTVTTNQTYYYTIQTFRTATNAEPVTSALSSVYPITVVDSIVPLPPQAVTVDKATDDPTALVIRWTNESSDTVIENTIYRSTEAGVVGDVLATVPVGTTEWLDTTVKPGVVYYYTVSASDAAGNESSINLPVAPHGNATPFLANSQGAL